MKKVWSIFVLLLLFAPFVAADIGDSFRSIWVKVVSVGNLEFLGLTSEVMVVSFTRLLIALFVFTVVFATIHTLGSGDHKFAPFSLFNRTQAGIIAFVLATITAVFLPASVLLATGVGWATAVALILIGGPILGIAVLCFKWPGNDEHGHSKETKGTVFVKIILCLLLLWILSAMAHHIGRIAGGA